MVLALSLLFLADAPPDWVRGAGAGAGAAVAAVAVRRRARPARAELARARAERVPVARWAPYALAGGIAAATVGPYLVLVLLACGAVELLLRRGRASPPLSTRRRRCCCAAAAEGGLGSLVWTALKVGALSFGGGFVIIPLMQDDAVHVYHWMTDAEFLNAVALGQVTPGPVVATIAAVGYAAAGIGGALLAAFVAFLPSFSFILLGGGRFERLRGNDAARGFLGGAGPAAIGAILGSAIPLAGALTEGWQCGRPCRRRGRAACSSGRGWCATLLGAGAVGAAVALVGGPLP